MDPPGSREPLQAGRRRPLGTVTRPTSVEAQDRFLDLLTATVCETAVDADASEPSFLQHSKRGDVVRGRAGVHRSVGSLGKDNLQCCARDAFPPVRSAQPVGHLELIVDSEGPDRSSDDSIDLDDAVRDASIGAQAGRPLEKGAPIGLALRRERGHPDRLRIGHLLIDRVEVPVLERPQRDVHLANPKGVPALKVSLRRSRRDHFGTRICASAPLWKRSSSTTSSFRCSRSSANGLCPTPIAIGTVVSWYSSTSPRRVSELAKWGPPWTRIVPSSSRAFRSAIAARTSPKISAGPQSAFSRVWEKTAFGFSFIAVAIGPSDAAQCGPMIS